MLLEVTEVNGGWVVFAGWPETVAAGDRYSSRQFKLIIPADDWVVAGRPGAVHINYEFTVCVPPKAR